MANMVLSAIFCMLLGYCAGGINPSYLISRMKGFDIRTRGSGNAGASNAMITLGKSTGIFCAIFDIFKAYVSVRISSRLFPLLKIAGMLSGIACILGHMYPILMKFNGGKGLACLGGVLLAYDSRLFFILLALELLVVLVTSYICSVATSGSVILSIIMFIQDGPLYALLFMPVVIAVWSKHMINFKRIKYGVEAKFKYLWNKSEEQERIKANWNRLSDDEKESVNLTELNV